MERRIRTKKKKKRVAGGGGGKRKTKEMDMEEEEEDDEMDMMMMREMMREMEMMTGGGGGGGKKKTKEMDMEEEEEEEEEMDMMMMREMEMMTEERPPLSELTPCEFAYVMDSLTETAKEQLSVLEQRESTFSNIKFFVEALKENNYLEPHEFNEYISKWAPMLTRMRTLYEEGLAIGKAWDDLSTREPPTSHSFIELKIHLSMSKIYKIPGQQEEIENCLRLTEAYLKERSEIEKRAFEYDKQESQMSKDIESDKDLCPHQLKKRMDEVVELIKTVKLAKDNGLDPLRMLQVKEMVSKAFEVIKVCQVASATPPSTTPIGEKVIDLESKGVLESHECDSFFDYMVSASGPIYANATPDVFEKNMNGQTKFAKEEKAAIKDRVKTIADFKSYVDELKKKGILEPHEFNAHFVKWKALFEVSRRLNEEGAALGKAWDELKKRKPPAHRNPVERSVIEKRAIEYEKRMDQMVNDMKSDPDLNNATIMKRIDEAVEIHEKSTKSRRRRGNA